MKTKYVRATVAHVIKVRKRAYKHAANDSVVEFLLNEQGFTMYKKRASYG